MRCESITPPGMAGDRHLHSSHQATTRQRGTCRPPISSQMLTLSGGKTKTVSPMRSIVPTLTLVSGQRRGTPRSTTSTSRRTSEGARAVLFSTAAPKNPTHPLQQPLTPSPHYPHTHGGYHPPVPPQCLMVAVLSYTWLQFPEGDAVSGWPGLAALTPSSRWIPDILIVPLLCE